MAPARPALVRLVEREPHGSQLADAAFAVTAASKCLLAKAVRPVYQARQAARAWRRPGA
jgi:hypothetical protein